MMMGSVNVKREAVHGEEDEEDDDEEMNGES